jgi:hypothetical protein
MKIILKKLKIIKIIKKFKKIKKKEDKHKKEGMNHIKFLLIELILSKKKKSAANTSRSEWDWNYESITQN